MASRKPQVFGGFEGVRSAFFACSLWSWYLECTPQASKSLSMFTTFSLNYFHHMLNTFWCFYNLPLLLVFLIQEVSRNQIFLSVTRHSGSYFRIFVQHDTAWLSICCKRNRPVGVEHVPFGDFDITFNDMTSIGDVKKIGYLYPCNDPSHISITIPLHNPAFRNAQQSLGRWHHFWWENYSNMPGWLNIMWIDDGTFLPKWSCVLAIKMLGQLMSRMTDIPQIYFSCSFVLLWFSIIVSDNIECVWIMLWNYHRHL